MPTRDRDLHIGSGLVLVARGKPGVAPLHDGDGHEDEIHRLAAPATARGGIPNRESSSLTVRTTSSDRRSTRSFFVKYNGSSGIRVGQNMALGVRRSALGAACSEVGLGWKRGMITGAISQGVPASPARIASLASKRDVKWTTEVAPSLP